MPRHVGIRMPEDFCDDVDGHAVFDGQRGERMPRAMRREILRSIRIACGSNGTRLITAVFSLGL